MRDEVLGFDEKAIEAEENLVIDVQFLIQGLLNESGMSRAELARKVGISKARLTQMLRPDANLQLRTIARVLHALGATATMQRCIPELKIETPVTSAWVKEDNGDACATSGEVGYDSVLAFKSLYSKQDRFLENRRSKLFDVVEAANDADCLEGLEVAA